MTRTNLICAVLGRLVLFSIIAGLIAGCESGLAPETAPDGSDLALGKVRKPAGGIESIWIEVAGVKVLRQTDGVWSWADVPLERRTRAERTFDLVAVADGLEAILGNATLEPGVYYGMRILVPRATVVIDGAEHPLAIPGNALRIREQFEVGPSGVPHLVLGSDPRLSVAGVGRVHPRFRMQALLDLGEPPPPPTTGTISGVVVPSVYALVTAYVAGTGDVAASVYTDQSTDGFVLAGLSPGTYDLEASASGYESGWEWDVALAAGETSDGHVLELIEIGGGEKR